MGANNEQEHALQLHTHLEKYVAERKFERDQLTYELQHIAELRAIKEKYRVPDRKSQYDVDDSHSDSSANQRQTRRPRATRQRSMPSDYSSMAVKSPQTDEPVSAVVVIPPEEHVNTVVIPPQEPAQTQEEQRESLPPRSGFPSLDEVD